jgi:hypothetical protein
MNLFSKIESIFGFDVKPFFTDYSSFVSGDLQNIVLFYKGNRNSSIEISQKKLKDLILRSEEIKEKIESSKSLFDSTDFYTFVDEFEDISLKLLSYLNLKKWVGSTNITNTVNYTLAQNESLDIAAQNLGYSDRDEGGLNLALANSVKETDYSLEGGFSFQMNYQSEALAIKIETLVGLSLMNEELLGRDFSRNLTFSDNDIKILSPSETFSQTCFILIKLVRGDNPEFPYSGMDKTLGVNRVSSATSLPILLRQLNDVVSADDTISKIVLRDVSNESDSLKLKCDFYSQLPNLKYISYEN